MEDETKPAPAYDEKAAAAYDRLAEPYPLSEDEERIAADFRAGRIPTMTLKNGKMVPNTEGE